MMQAQVQTRRMWSGNNLLHLIQQAWDVVREHRRAYIGMNLVYYGLTVLAMVYVAFNQPLQRMLIQQVGITFTEGLLSAVGGVYIGGQILAAIVLTFGVNLLIGSLASITLPSLIIPFSGLLLGVYRATLWGLILSPAAPDLRTLMIPHSLTLILEGQAYVLAMLAAWIQGRAFLFPRSVGAPTHAQGYRSGVKLSLRIYVLVIICLAVAAVYESFEVILLSR